MAINGNSSSEELLMLLVKIGQDKAPLELMNVYNGVTITQKVVVTSFGQDFIEIQASYYQYMCIALQGHTYLSSPGLPCLVCANLNNFKLISAEIRLNDFSCLSRLSESRFTGRVVPQEPIRTILHLKNNDFSASVADLSAQGLGIWAYKIREKGIVLEPNAPINLDYYLPRQSKKFTLKGKVAYLKPARSWLMFRLGVCIKPNNEQESKLQDYIHLRHQDILRELEQTFNRSYEPRRSADIYF